MASERKTPERKMSPAQRAYEAKRAAKAGVSLDKWLDQKDRDRAAEARAAVAPTAKPRKPGLLSRLIERAHKPLS